jgi:excisionase family DNA binding protein
MRLVKRETTCSGPCACHESGGARKNYAGSSRSRSPQARNASCRPATRATSGWLTRYDNGRSARCADRQERAYYDELTDLIDAAALLGLGRTTAYRLVHDGQWPTPVLRLGRLIKIPTQPLLDLLAGVARTD